jgi:NhaP-type Na+/H+ or K+/H+ antiporter
MPRYSVLFVLAISAILLASGRQDLHGGDRKTGYLWCTLAIILLTASAVSGVLFQKWMMAASSAVGALVGILLVRRWRRV